MKRISLQRNLSTSHCNDKRSLWHEYGSSEQETIKKGIQAPLGWILSLLYNSLYPSYTDFEHSANSLFALY